MVARATPEPVATKVAAPETKPPSERNARDAVAWAELEKQGPGATVECKIEVANRGGVVVRLSGLNITGFVPVSQLDPARVPAHGKEATPETFLAPLVGQRMKAKVLECQPSKGTLVLSERASLADAELEKLTVGAVRTGVVETLTDYGAFVQLLGVDGVAHGVTGLLHVSELSWSRVKHPSDIVRIGQTVSVKVVSVDVPTRRIGLSMRQLEADPLLETLDTLLPTDSNRTDAGASGSYKDGGEELPGLLDICDALRDFPGIDSVTLGRQAQEQRVVSQDLELWMTNDTVAGGFNLVARAGRQVQEVLVKTSLTKDDIKRAILQVTSRMP